MPIRADVALNAKPSDMSTALTARTLTTAAAVASSPASRTHTRAVPCVAHALSAGRATFGRGAQLLKAKVRGPVALSPRARRPHNRGVTTPSPIARGSLPPALR